MRLLTLLALLLLGGCRRGYECPTQPELPEIPAKLLDLDQVRGLQPRLGSWTQLSGHWYTSGHDTAQVFPSLNETEPVVIAKVAGWYWIKASFFSWWLADADELSDYNRIARATPADPVYLNFHPFDLAFTVALEHGGRLPPGALPPRRRPTQAEYDSLQALPQP